MIKNIVFDISNVRAPFRFKEFLAEKGFDAAMIQGIIERENDNKPKFPDSKQPGCPEGKTMFFDSLLISMGFGV